jgi:hypothetical protein
VRDRCVPSFSGPPNAISRPSRPIRTVCGIRWRGGGSTELGPIESVFPVIGQADSRALHCIPAGGRTRFQGVIRLFGMLLARVIGRLLIAAFVLLCLDGCFHRDPTVDLADGYGIVATSAASPCFLDYQPWVDKREYSGWHAITSTTIHTPEGEEQTPFWLTHDELDWVSFENEEEWRRAWHEKKATFGPKEIGRVEGITGFREEGRYVVGAYDKGFFLLDIAQNRLHTWRDEATWADAVQSATGRAPRELRDPRSWLVQSRNLVVLGALATVLLPWCAWPLVRRNRLP